MFTTVKSLTAKYLLATLLVSGVFFGFSQTVLAEENLTVDPGTSFGVVKANESGAMIIPPGTHVLEGGYVNGQFDANRSLAGVSSQTGSVVVVADPNERVSDQTDALTNQDDQTDDESLSNQFGFDTPIDGCSTDCGGDEAVSEEHDFSTDSDTCTVNCNPNDEVISGEHDFNTSDDTCTTNCGGGDEAVSEEHDFNTQTDGCTTNCGGGDEVVSDQHDFNTNNDGCTSNCGGGGGGCTGSCGTGGGGTGGGIIKPETLLPPGCKPFLLKFIRYGYNNDPYEVRKLQAFLDVFEGYKLPITGIYDRETEQAVRAFQSKYASDVLTPWGITDNTGYVFITTLLKINYIYCGITTPIDVDLRSRFPGFEIGPAGLQEIETNFEQPNAIPLPVPEVATSTGFFQAAAAGLLEGLNWLWNHLCWLAWLLVLILLAVIAYLLMRLRESKQRLAKYENIDGGMTEDGSLTAAAAGVATIAAVPLGDTLAEDDDTLIAEPETDDWQNYLDDSQTVGEVLPVTMVENKQEEESSEIPGQMEEKTTDYENDLKALLEALDQRNNKEENN